MSILTILLPILILVGISFSSIKCDETLIPDNALIDGENFDILRGILLPPHNNPFKLLPNELQYKIEIKFKNPSNGEFMKDMPKLTFKTNKYGGFMANIPKEYEATGKHLVLTFKHQDEVCFFEIKKNNNSFLLLKIWSFI